MAKKKRRLKKEVLVVLIISVSVICAVFAIMIYRKFHSFKYSDNLEDIVVTIDKCDINLKEISYYVMKAEEQGQENAKIYDEKNPESYWSLYMNDEFKRSGYVSDLAKMSAMDNCIRDNMYYMEATEKDFSLPGEIAEDIKYDAENLYNHMTQRERETTGLQPADLELIMLKEKTSHEYILTLAGLYDEDQVIDTGKVMNIVSSVYDINGTYYEALKEKYGVTINEDIWKKVRVGFVTIN